MAIRMKHKKALVEYCLNGFFDVENILCNDVVIKLTT